MLNCLIRRILNIDALEAYMEEMVAYVENFPEEDDNA